MAQQETLCPNCKGKSELVKVGQADYVKCPECGWFETQADGSISACDPPKSDIKSLLSPTPPSLKPKEAVSDGGPREAPPSQPPSDPSDQQAGDDSVTLRINFED